MVLVRLTYPIQCDDNNYLRSSGIHDGGSGGVCSRAWSCTNIPSLGDQPKLPGSRSLSRNSQRGTGDHLQWRMLASSVCPSCYYSARKPQLSANPSVSHLKISLLPSFMSCAPSTPCSWTRTSRFLLISKPRNRRCISVPISCEVGTEADSSGTVLPTFSVGRCINGAGESLARLVRELHGVEFRCRYARSSRLRQLPAAAQ